MEKISIVVPCYNEEKALPYFYKEIDKVSKKMKSLVFELLFVDDGSNDRTLEVLKDLSKEDKRVKYLSYVFSRGKLLYKRIQSQWEDILDTLWQYELVWERLQGWKWRLA